MGRAFTVLVTSAGRRVELLACLRRAVAGLGPTPRILACDLDPGWSAACHLADAAFAAPPCGDPAYPAFLLDLCARERVRLLVPTIDPELRPLAEVRDHLRALGTWPNLSGAATVAICRDKLATARALAAAGVPVPEMVLLVEAAAVDLPRPWILKPRDGSAGRGIRRVHGPEDIPPDLDPTRYVAQRQLRGPEYTTTLYVDRTGRLRGAVTHRRVRVRGGEVEKGEVVDDPLFVRLAERVAAALPDPYGVLCFQTIVGEDGPRVFEINARFGGGFPLADRAGAPFARWLVQEALDRPLDPLAFTVRRGLRVIRYDCAIYPEPEAKPS